MIYYHLKLLLISQHVKHSRFSLELRRRIRQDSDSDRQVSHLNRSEVVEGSASFINNSNQSSYTKSSYNPNFEDRNIFNHGKFSNNGPAIE